MRPGSSDATRSNLHQAATCPRKIAADRLGARRARRAVVSPVRSISAAPPIGGLMLGAGADPRLVSLAAARDALRRAATAGRRTRRAVVVRGDSRVECSACRRSRCRKNQRRLETAATAAWLFGSSSSPHIAARDQAVLGLGEAAGSSRRNYSMKAPRLPRLDALRRSARRSAARPAGARPRARGRERGLRRVLLPDRLHDRLEDRQRDLASRPARRRACACPWRCRSRPRPRS